MKKVRDHRILRRTLTPLACATLLAACAPYPHADSGYATARVDSQAAAFDRLDVNGDGFLSRAEAESLGVRAQSVSAESTTSAFHRLDTNGDGFLSRAEAQATIATIPGASFEASDADRDGFLNLAEATPHLRWLESRSSPGGVSFESLDSNRDGFLSRAEAAAALTPAHAGARQVLAPVAYSFETLDTDRDGFLSRAEAAPAANPPTFDHHDANRDGFLSRAEAQPLIGIGATGSAPNGRLYGPR